MADVLTFKRSVKILYIVTRFIHTLHGKSIISHTILTGLLLIIINYKVFLVRIFAFPFGVYIHTLPTEFANPTKHNVTYYKKFAYSDCDSTIFLKKGRKRGKGMDTSMTENKKGNKKWATFAQMSYIILMKINPKLKYLGRPANDISFLRIKWFLLFYCYVHLPRRKAHSHIHSYETYFLICIYSEQWRKIMWCGTPPLSAKRKLSSVRSNSFRSPCNF